MNERKTETQDTPRDETSSGATQPKRERPPAGANNLWYFYNDSDTVLVFVHGIFSDSRGCWFYDGAKAGKESVFWPELVLGDSRIGPASIFLGGFYTAIDAGQYDIGDSAEELFSAMNREDPEHREPPMAKQNIIFICHSTGGIVVRYLLDHYYDRFKSKTVGLALIASPSYGSVLANKLSPLARFYRQELGLQLEWGNTNLQLLDERFKTLVEEKRIPKLVGVEAFENHFIVHRKFLPDRVKVVDEQSAGRGYFGRPVLLRQTDHFSTVKPPDVHHPGHELLVDFWARHFAGIAHAEPHTPAEKSVPGYFCYISRDKVDQLWDGQDEGPLPAGILQEVKDALASNPAYGRPDIIQRNAAVKREYLRKLRRVLAKYAGQVSRFGADGLQAGGLYWARAPFKVAEIDEKALIARLEAQIGERQLVLHCSLANFSDEMVESGRPRFHSMNYAFFERNLTLEFETVFYFLSCEKTECYGSPLYLRLPIMQGVVL